MAKQPYRRGNRSKDRKVELLAQASRPIAPPPGLMFRSDDEREYYIKLLHYRAFDDWMPADFERLKWASETWWDICLNDTLAGDEPYIMADPKGRHYINPRFALIDRLKARHDAILRGMKIAQPAIDPKTVAKRRGDATAARAALDDDRLLAKPAAPRAGLTLVKDADR
jgi:hypothetical protein